MTIGIHTIVRPTGAVVASPIEDGSVLVDTDRGGCWELNRQGSWIWERLVLLDSLSEVASAFAERFGLPLEKARSDVLELVFDLEKAGLVTVDVDSGRVG